MASQTQTESLVIELATESFKAFCDDIAGMFGIGMECEQKEVRAETVAGLKKCFRKLVAVNVVETTGVLEGTFQLVFDQEGLFTLGGVIVMLPEQKILANRKDPSPQLAASMVDAVGEAGNLLVGSWDRVFREGLTRHGHFLQKLPAFIGKPWDDPQNKIGLPADGELIYVPYEMTIGSYPSFQCGVVFPKSLFAARSEASKESDSESQEVAPQDQVHQDVQANPEKAGSQKPGPSDKSDTTQDSKESKQESPAGEEAIEEGKPPEAAAAVSAPAETSQGAQNAAEDKTKIEQPAAAQEDAKKEFKSPQGAAQEMPANEGQAKKDTPDTAVEETVKVQAEATETQAGPAAEPQPAGAAAEQEHAAAAAEAAPDAIPAQEYQEPAAGKVSEAIQKLTQSYTVPAGERGDSTLSESETSAPVCVTVKDKNGTRQVPDRRRKNTGLNKCLSICAKDIMHKQVVWASPEETVQQTLAKMQQHDTGYVMVGTDGTLEGIVSRSDITGALSPYLRSIFAKWRRPLDDATLKIKIKWIMSRPVRTVGPQTPLVTIMESVCRFGGAGLPVVDEHGKVQGLVTVFNVFQMMLNAYADVSTAGRAPQTPPLT